MILNDFKRFWLYVRPCLGGDNSANEILSLAYHIHAFHVECFFLVKSVLFLFSIHILN